MTLKAAAIFLAVSGVTAVFSGSIVPQLPSIPTSAGAALLFPPSGHWPLVYAAMVLALALGVWRRRPWAWWGFFVLLAASACWTVYAMQASTNFGPPLGVGIIFAVMCCAVTVLWGRWWYGQRKHFNWS